MINWIAPILRRRTLAAALVASLVAAIYWGLVASDRYVSEAHVVVQGTDFANAQTVSLGSLIGTGVSGNQADQLLLRDHLLSVDMLRKLDAKLNLRAHYSDSSRDPVSRMWFKDAALEMFHRHYLSRVTVEFDDVAGIVVIRAEAYDAGTAYAIASMLVEEGERFMNDMARSLAQVRVGFLEKQVVDVNQRVIRARQTMLDFQNQKGLVSPQVTVENFAATVYRLEGQLTDLQTRRSAMLAYLVKDSPGIVELNQHIAAVDSQIRKEKARLTSPNDKTLNLVADEYLRLQLNADFAMEIYKTALVGLETGRVDATRAIKKVSVLQSPYEPQYPLEPRRIYNTFVFTLIALAIAGILHLLGAVIRDHLD